MGRGPLESRIRASRPVHRKGTSGKPAADQDSGFESINTVVQEQALKKKNKQTNKQTHQQDNNNNNKPTKKLGAVKTHSGHESEPSAQVC